MSKPEFEKVVYNGEEYAVVQICPMTGYPKRYVEGKTPEEVEAFLEQMKTIEAEFLCDHLSRAKALERKEWQDDAGGTFIEYKLLVLIKCQTLEAMDREDPEQNLPHSCDT